MLVAVLQGGAEIRLLLLKVRHFLLDVLCLSVQSRLDIPQIARQEPAVRSACEHSTPCAQKGPPRRKKINVHAAHTLV